MTVFKPWLSQAQIAGLASHAFISCDPYNLLVEVPNGKSIPRCCRRATLFPRHGRAIPPRHLRHLASGSHHAGRTRVRGTAGPLGSAPDLGSRPPASQRPPVRRPLRRPRGRTRLACRRLLASLSRPTLERPSSARSTPSKSLRLRPATSCRHRGGMGILIEQFRK